MARAQQQFKPDTALLKAISKTIKQLRRENSFSQIKYADLCKIHWRTVQRVEKESPNISIGLFARLAEGFNISPDKLMLLALSNIK
ncbi:helix-turn-helix domain-containing protein [Candidatus Margulisiibacteriota bacterium]